MHGNCRGMPNMLSTDGVPAITTVIVNNNTNARTSVKVIIRLE